MAKVRVPLWQQPNKYAVVDTAGSTSGATIGVNVFMPDGSLYQPVASAPSQPAPQGVTVWSFIQNVPANVRAVEALTGTGLVSREHAGDLVTLDIQRPAAAALSSLRAVSIGTDGKVAYPDRTVADDALRFLGVLLTSASAADEQVTIRRQGRITEGAWSWTPGPVWVGDSGQLTQTPPPTGWILQVGMAINETTIDIDPEPVIL